MPGVSTTTRGKSTLRGLKRRQHVEQLRSVVVDGQDRRVLEHLGEHLLRDHAVLEHVRDARRHAQVVLEHVDRAVAIAHEIRAADVRPDAVRRLAADARRQKVRRRRDDVVRHDAVVDDAPVVVEIVDEVIQRLQPLNQAALDARPLRRLDRARNDVERPRAVDVLAFGVDRERDAHLDDRPLGVGLPLGERTPAERRQIVGELSGRRPGRAGRGEQLVVEARSVGIGSSRYALFWVTIRARKSEIDSTKRCSLPAASTKLVPLEEAGRRAAPELPLRLGRPALLRCAHGEPPAERAWAKVAPWVHSDTV